MKEIRFYRTLCFLILLLSGAALQGQTSMEIISKLCSAEMKGRGFSHGADRKVARYLTGIMRKAGAIPFQNGYEQEFNLDVNTFPGKMKLVVNGHKLVPGADYMVDPASPSLKGIFTPVTVSMEDILSGRADQKLRQNRGMVIRVNHNPQGLTKEQKNTISQWILHQVYFNPAGIKALAEVTSEKLLFGTSSTVSKIPWLILRAGVVPDTLESLRVEVENEFLRGYPTRNLAGYVKGTVCPDSLIVFSSHYDHLGLMGKGNFFPGANDNASGVSMVMQLLQYFSTHPQRFSVAFLFFSGEEAGIMGSRYFADNPLFDMKRVKFLINLDLVGAGSDGIMVINATEFQQTFDRLNQLNEEGGYISLIRKRGKACNSDHCPFYEKGVPCFFIYTLGGSGAYHDLQDRPDNLPLTAFDGLIRLVIRFTGTF